MAQRSRGPRQRLGAKEPGEVEELPEAQRTLPVEVRCIHCNKLLLKVARLADLPGIEIKCPRCREVSWL